MMRRTASLHRLWCALLTIPLALSAHAQAPHAKSAKGTAATTGDARPTSKSTLTAEDVGKRYLALLEGIASKDDLTVGRVQSTLGLTLKESPNGPFLTQSLGDGWLYVISLHPESRPGGSISLNLEFIDPSDRFADMSSICGLTFENYHNALKAMGYRDVFQYDQIDGQVGRLLGVDYRKEGFFVSIQPEVKRFSDGKVYPTCVRRIGLLVTGPEAQGMARPQPDAWPETTTNPANDVEDVGQRFLKLIARLHAREPLSLGAFAEAMGVPVARMEPRHNGFSTSVAIDDRWSYALELWQESASGPWVAINLQFDHADDHEHADFSPVCGTSLAAYREAFKASGYSEALDRDASGGLLAVAYATDRMFIVLTPGMKVSDEASSPSCVSRIELMNRAKPS